MNKYIMWYSRKLMDRIEVDNNFLNSFDDIEMLLNERIGG